MLTYRLPCLLTQYNLFYTTNIDKFRFELSPGVHRNGTEANQLLLIQPELNHPTQTPVTTSKRPAKRQAALNAQKYAKCALPGLSCTVYFHYLCPAMRDIQALFETKKMYIVVHPKSYMQTFQAPFKY